MVSDTTSEPPLVLAFDTAAARCAAALVRGDDVLARRDEAMERGQAERLLPMLEEMLAEAGADWRDLDGIGVVTGPGNFTGVRLAVAAARGLALALGIPAVGVSVFEALAGRPGAVTVTLADKRGRFSQRFRDGVALGAAVRRRGRRAGGSGARRPGGGGAPRGAAAGGRAAAGAALPAAGGRDALLGPGAGPPR